MDYRPSLKTTRMTAVRDDIDSGPGPGTLEVCTAGFATTIITFTLIDPCGTVSGDTLTFTMTPTITANAAASGTAAVGRIKNSTGSVVVDNLVVGRGGSGQILLGTLDITQGQPYELLSLSIQHA